MIQNAKLFDILPIPNQLLFQYKELINFKYMQYFGTQSPLAIISSLIHYSFIQKFDRFTSLILEFQFQSKESRIIQNQLYQSYKSENPIKEFFKDYFLDQDKAYHLKELMVQLCLGMNWMDNQTTNLTKIAQNLQITFIILPERKIYGLESNQQKILLYFNNNQIFFVIPLQLLENYNLCQLCRKLCKQYYGKTKCGHSIYCTSCLQKPQFQTYIQCARCNTRTLKTQIQLLQDERILYETYLKYQKSIIDQSQQRVVQNQPQQNQVYLEQQQNFCDQCGKPEDLIDNFVFETCEHQFCYKCLKKCENYAYSKLLRSCLKCQSTCSKLSVDQYNEFYESAYSQPQIENKSKCNQCLKDSNYELFKVKKCNHQFCFDCVNAKIRNQKYKSSYLSCLLLKCSEVCDYEDCFNYIKIISQKKVDESQNKIIKDQNLQQSVKSEFCQSCNQVFPFELFEVKKCHHKFCTKCLQRLLTYQECFCPSNHCVSKIKKTEYEEYIQKLQNFSKQGMQEATKKQQDSQSSKNLQIVEINEKSFEQTLEKTKSISQNQELIANKTVGPKQNQQLKQNLTEKDLKVETNNELKNNDLQKESKKEFDVKQLEQVNKNQKNEIKQQPISISEQKQEIKQEIKNESKNENHSDESTKNSLPSSDNPLVKKDSKEDSSQDSIKISLQDNKSKNLQKDQPDQKYKNLSVINQDAWIEEDSLDTIVIEQIQEFDKQEKEETKGSCTYCGQDFSIYNRKQQVECPIHKIGVCCMLLPYQKCPQCEIINFKLKHSKAKLNIPKIALEIGLLFDETVPYPTKLYKKFEMDKTQIRQSDYNARNNLHTSAQRSSTQDYLQNSRFGSVDNRLNQQLVSQHQRIEPRKENYYDPTIFSNHKPVIINRQPQYRQIQPQYSYQRYI